MGTFAVILQDTDPEQLATTREQIMENYPSPGHFEISDEVILVSGSFLSSHITKTLGIDDNPEMRLIVLSLNGSFSGRSWAHLWEWLRAADQGTL